MRLEDADSDVRARDYLQVFDTYEDYLQHMVSVLLRPGVRPARRVSFSSLSGAASLFDSPCTAGPPGALPLSPRAVAAAAARAVGGDGSPARQMSPITLGPTSMAGAIGTGVSTSPHTEGPSFASLTNTNSAAVAGTGNGTGGGGGMATVSYASQPHQGDSDANRVPTPGQPLSPAPVTATGSPIGKPPTSPATVPVAPVVNHIPDSVSTNSHLRYLVMDIDVESLEEAKRVVTALREAQQNASALAFKYLNRGERRRSSSAAVAGGAAAANLRWRQKEAIEQQRSKKGGKAPPAGL